MSTETIPTRYPTAAWIRLVLFSFIGVAPGALTVTALIGIDIGDWTGLDHDFDIVIAGVALLVLFTSIALPLVCLKIREPGPSKVVVDPSGVTEWDGDQVRTAIPWEGSGVFLLETQVVDRRSGRRWVGGVTLSIASPRGFVINTGWGGWPRQALRHRFWSSNEFPTAAITANLGPMVRKLGERVWDPRDDRRPLFVFARIVGALYLAAVGGGIAQATNDLGTNGAQLSGLLFFLGSVMMALRCLRPIVENFRVSKEGAPCRRAVPMTFAGEAGGAFVRATDAQGRPYTLDCSAAAHPDAWIARRGGTVFVALDQASAGAGGYRDAPLRVIALETARDRRERSRVLWANRIEIFARLTLATLLTVLAVLLVAGLQVH